MNREVSDGCSMDCASVFLQGMNIVEVEKLALNLPEPQRAVLAANLLRSLPAVLSDGDEGVVEALRRDAEIEAGSSPTLSLDEVDSEIRSRRS